MRHSRSSSSCALVLAAGLASAAPEPRYIIEDMGVFPGLLQGFPDGGAAFGRAINEHGDVAGLMHRGALGLDERTIVTFFDGAATDLVPDLDPTINCDILSYNDDGSVLAIIGLFDPSRGGSFLTPYLIRDGVGSSQFVSDVPGSISHGVYEMNNARQFAGNVFMLATPPARPTPMLVRWSTGGVTPELIPCLDGPARPYDMNEQGDFAGFASTSSGAVRPFLVRGSTFINLSAGFTTHIDGIAYGMNESTHVVGYGLKDAQNHPILWDGMGGRTILPLLQGQLNGTAHGINNEGIIVGQCSGWLGTMWRDGEAINLNHVAPDAASSGWENLGPAHAINNRGQITGYGTRQITPSFTDIRAYRLTPWCDADLTGSSDPNDPAYGQADGTSDLADFFYFLDQFVAGNASIADLTGSSDPNAPTYGEPDGVLDAADFFFYLDLFGGPCWR